MSQLFTCLWAFIRMLLHREEVCKGGHFGGVLGSNSMPKMPKGWQAGWCRNAVGSNVAESRTRFRSDTQPRRESTLYTRRTYCGMRRTHCGKRRIRVGSAKLGRATCWSAIGSRDGDVGKVLNVPGRIQRAVGNGTDCQRRPHMQSSSAPRKS
jgi:hypothetical protein